MQFLLLLLLKILKLSNNHTLYSNNVIKYLQLTQDNKTDVIKAKDKATNIIKFIQIGQYINRNVLISYNYWGVMGLL